jgi:hypothetical protein
MSKPLGLGLSLNEGDVTFRVAKPSRAQDKIWEAVQEAIAANMTPKQFIQEAWESWEHERTESVKAEGKQFYDAMRAMKGGA